MISLLITLAMLFVILLSLAAGVGLGYAIIFGILYAFDRSRQPIRRAPVPTFGASSGND